MTQAHDFFIPGPAGKLSVRAKGLESQPEQIVVLVQGANLCGQTGYDFTFPGGADYSLAPSPSRCAVMASRTRRLTP